jgi:SagB-type dehydrogenase family enzyme
MESVDPFFCWTELDRTTFPAWRERMASFDALPDEVEPRSYPGYPCWPLPQFRPRMLVSLDRVLHRRRSVQVLGSALPSRSKLGRLLQFSHGLTAGRSRGPVPSAGGLQALELYMTVLEAAWLPAGLYHYDRPKHHLSQIVAGAARADWLECIPSLHLIEGGALLWIVVGDSARVNKKYGARGLRFLLLEAGHLLQNVCLMSASLGLATVPLGGFFEGEIARAFLLPAADRVLYVGVCGENACRPRKPLGKLPVHDYVVAEFARIQIGGG